MDWNRRTCARRGHATYAPTEPALRDRLFVETAVGGAWRCLRCGDFVPGEPRGSGPANQAPIILRGRALRDRLILRLLAVERVLRFVLIAFIAWAIYEFGNNVTTLQSVFERDLTALKPLADRFNYNLDDSSMVHTIRGWFLHAHSTYTWAAVALLVYALIELVEGVGLWFAKRWAEYFTVFATAIFIPLEVRELTEKVTWMRVAAFVINVAAIVYLIVAKRLFGVRGGARALEAHQREDSLLEVREAADLGPAPEHRSAHHPGHAQPPGYPGAIPQGAHPAMSPTTVPPTAANRPAVAQPGAMPEPPGV